MDYLVPPKTLHSVLSEVVEAKAEYDLRLLAQQLGTNYRSLMYWLRGDRHGEHHQCQQHHGDGRRKLPVGYGPEHGVPELRSVLGRG